jgi:hypothetical protein
LHSSHLQSLLIPIRLGLSHLIWSHVLPCLRSSQLLSWSFFQQPLQTST